MITLNPNKGALAYMHQAHRAQEWVLGKTHPDTLATTNILGLTYDRLDDSVKAEEMYRLAYDGFEKTLGKDYKETKGCAKTLTCIHERLEILT